MKTQEVPHYLRGFNDIFSYFDYTHSTHTVWNDFLNLAVYGLAYSREQARIDEIAARYKEKEQAKLWELFDCIVRLYADAKSEGEWIDPLGDYYEVLSSKGSKQWFGQFFTPHSVCEMIAQITAGADKPVGKANLDPACGSGRLLLAFNHLYPNNFMFGSDLDKTCVLMTALNLCLQGAKGEVCWKNALDINDHRLILAINIATFDGVCLPSIIEIEKEQSFMYAMDMKLIAKKEPKLQVVAPQPEELPKPKSTALRVQVSLF